MQVANTLNNTIRILFNPRIEPFKLFDFLVVKSDESRYVAQIIEIYDDKFDSSQNVAKIKLFYRINQNNEVMPYDNFTPNKECEIVRIKQEEIETFINQDNDTFVLGTNLKNSSALNIQYNFIDNNAVILADKVEHATCMSCNLAKKLSAKRSVVILDSTGNLELEGAKVIKAAKNFKMPFNFVTIDHVFNRCLNDSSLEFQAIGGEILNEIKKYAKKQQDQFIPFNMMAKVLTEQYNATPYPELKVLLMRLKKFQMNDIFAKNKTEKDNLLKTIEKNEITIIDISTIDTYWQKAYIDYIISSVEKEIYLITRINDEQFDVGLINKIYSRKDKIKFVPNVSYNYKKLPTVMQHCKNYILMPSLHQRNDFLDANFALANLIQEGCVVFGKDTDNFLYMVRDYELENQESRKNYKKIVLTINPEQSEFTGIHGNQKDYYEEKERLENLSEEEVSDFNQSEMDDFEEEIVFKKTPIQEVEPQKSKENFEEIENPASSDEMTIEEDYFAPIELQEEPQNEDDEKETEEIIEENSKEEVIEEAQEEFVQNSKEEEIEEPQEEIEDVEEAEEELTTQEPLTTQEAAIEDIKEQDDFQELDNDKEDNLQEEAEEIEEEIEEEVVEENSNEEITLQEEAQEEPDDYFEEIIQENSSESIDENQEEELENADENQEEQENENISIDEQLIEKDDLQIETLEVEQDIIEESKEENIEQDLAEKEPQEEIEEEKEELKEEIITEEEVDVIEFDLPQKEDNAIKEDEISLEDNISIEVEDEIKIETEELDIISDEQPIKEEAQETEKEDKKEETKRSILDTDLVELESLDDSVEEKTSQSDAENSNEEQIEQEEVIEDEWQVPQEEAEEETQEEEQEEAQEEQTEEDDSNFDLSDDELDFFQMASDSEEEYDEDDSKQSQDDDIDLNKIANNSIDDNFNEIINTKKAQKAQTIAIDENTKIDEKALKNKNNENNLPIFKDENKEKEEVVIYEVGNVIVHAKYGKGTVVKIIKYEDRQLIQVDFEEADKKLLDPQVAKIMLVEQ